MRLITRLFNVGEVGHFLLTEVVFIFTLNIPYAAIYIFLLVNLNNRATQYYSGYNRNSSVIFSDVIKTRSPCVTCNSNRHYVIGGLHFNASNLNYCSSFQPSPNYTKAISKTIM